MNLINKKLDVYKILKTVNAKSKFRRYSILILSLFVVAMVYNLFFLPNNIVYGGVSGLAIIVNKKLGIDPSSFIMICSVLLLILSFITLGFEKTKGSVIGSVLFPVFVKYTAQIIEYFDLSAKVENRDLLLIIVFGAVVHSIAYGLILKEGFSTGGTDILNQITEKYAHVSLGTALLINDGLIVVSGLFFFGPVTVLYALLVLYIMSVVMDRVILGISDKKMFLIITNNQKEVRKFVMEQLNIGLTVFDVQNDNLMENKKVLMAVIPTKDYYRLREEILSVDPKAFFVVTDSYQVLGGV